MMPQERLERVADALDQAVRQGAAEDNPEGTRYIVISDTLAKKMASDIRKALDDLT